ncbi:MAG: CotH kinase family protein [Oscillospiraceae bacterium]
MNGSYYEDTVSGERADILGTMLQSVFTPEQTAVAALQYVGDTEEDYANLWDTAVFKPKSADKMRLMQSIKTLNISENPQSVLDVETLLKYFAVHSFVNNYDGYTSLFVHNFYLHEQEGILSMVPWDYNLAFGSFTYETVVSSILEGSNFNAIPDTGAAMDIETSMINYPIDTPIYSIEMKDRPILNALLSEPETLEKYHQFYDQLLKECFENGKYTSLYTQTYENIRPYVTQGLTFYETEQFDKGAEAMQQYLQYRSESVRKQLNGSLPSTLQGQQNHAENLVIPEGLHLSALADFASLKPELNAEMITSVLNIFLQEQFSYDTKGAVEAIHHYAANPLSLVAKIPALLQISTIRNLVLQKSAPVLVFLFLVILAVVIFKIHKKKATKMPLVALEQIENDPFFLAS